MMVEELRKTDRFVVIAPVAATFGSSDTLVVNFSITGVQISHPQPIRIGTVARLSFHRGEAFASVEARVIWSHAAKSPGGTLVYRTGLRIENVDAHYALALNTLLRADAVQRDRDSLERKRRRDEEREEKKKSGPKVIPFSDPPPA
jgi:hypothetical protein